MSSTSLAADNTASRGNSATTGNSVPRPNLLQDLEHRQDEVLRMLDELNARIEALLSEHRPENLAVASLIAVEGATSASVATAAA